jgi:hypothetical protein
LLQERTSSDRSVFIFTATREQTRADAMKGAVPSQTVGHYRRRCRPWCNERAILREAVAELVASRFLICSPEPDPPESDGRAIHKPTQSDKWPAIQGIRDQEDSAKVHHS